MSFNEPMHLLPPQPDCHEEEAPHRWKCCRCKQYCVRVDDAEWPAMQVSKCCGQIAYRVEA